MFPIQQTIEIVAWFQATARCVIPVACYARVHMHPPNPLQSFVAWGNSILQRHLYYSKPHIYISWDNIYGYDFALTYKYYLSCCGTRLASECTQMHNRNWAVIMYLVGSTAVVASTVIMYLFNLTLIWSNWANLNVTYGPHFIEIVEI